MSINKVKIESCSSPGHSILCDDTNRAIAIFYRNEDANDAICKINKHDSLVAFIRKVAKEQDGTLLGNEASQLLAGMGEL